MVAAGGGIFSQLMLYVTGIVLPVTAASARSDQAAIAARRLR